VCSRICPRGGAHSRAKQCAHRPGPFHVPPGPTVGGGARRTDGIETEREKKKRRVGARDRYVGACACGWPLPAHTPQLLGWRGSTAGMAPSRHASPAPRTHVAPYTAPRISVRPPAAAPPPPPPPPPVVRVKLQSAPERPHVVRFTLPATAAAPPPPPVIPPFAAVASPAPPSPAPLPLPPAPIRRGVRASAALVDSQLRAPLGTADRRDEPYRMPDTHVLAAINARLPLYTMATAERAALPAYVRVQSRYCEHRNRILALWFARPGQWLTADEVRVCMTMYPCLCVTNGGGGGGGWAR
jgi:hypothetical protein